VKHKEDVERKQVDVPPSAASTWGSQACQVSKRGWEKDLTYEKCIFCRFFFPKYFVSALSFKEAAWISLLRDK